MVMLSAVVALSTCTAKGVYEWWAGRVEKMKVKLSRTSKLVFTAEPVQLDVACAEKALVACPWYRKHRGYIFTYNGPVDYQLYLLENELGLLNLQLPDERGR